MTVVSFAWIVYIFASCVELGLLSVKATKLVRSTLGIFVLGLLAFSHTVLLVNEPALFGVSFFIIGLYRQLNIARFVYGRMHDAYLYKVVARTSLVLGLTQAVLGTASVFVNKASLHGLLYVITYLSFIGAITATFVLARALTRSIFLGVKSTVKDLPTVTVAIPARNETEDLQACLNSFTASTYQKLEILVLDDCSQDNSSDIIKKYAHDGVRFIKGSEPDDTWLPKNAAYQKLLHEASGDLVLFCGVDVRVLPETIGLLVQEYLSSGVSMLGILPKRADKAAPSTTMQLLRYYWELALPRQIVNRPPVLSTMWLAEVKMLKLAGSFLAVKRMVTPEAYFARFAAKNTSYRFIVANAQLNTYSTKGAKEQRSTAVRSRYPQLHKRPEMVLAVFAAELLLVAMPFAALPYAVITHRLLLGLVASLALLFYAVSGALLVSKVIAKNKLQALIQALLMLPTDLWLLHYSMYKYEFSRVEWKERNVCLPVMHITPSLPKLED